MTNVERLSEKLYKQVLGGLRSPKNAFPAPTGRGNAAAGRGGKGIVRGFAPHTPPFRTASEIRLRPFV
jgi:hypothetical protein